MSSTQVWQKLRARSRQIAFFLPLFFRQPVEHMKSPPKWDWATILILHTAFGAGTGVLKSVLELRFSTGILNAFAGGFSALLIGGLGSVLVFLFLVLYLNRKEDWLKIYIVVALASLPLLLLRILGAFQAMEAPADLLGFALMCLLLTVSLVEVFRIPRRQVARWMGGVFLVVFIIWSAGIIERSRENIDQGPQITPESMDVLKREFSSVGQ